MGIYVYRARSPKKGLQEVTIGNETVSAAVAEYAYKMSFDAGFYTGGDRYLNPTERAWERWLKEGNEKPEYIIYSEKVFRWNGEIAFDDYAPESWEQVESSIEEADTK